MRVLSGQNLDKRNGRDRTGLEGREVDLDRAVQVGDQVGQRVAGAPEIDRALERLVEQLLGRAILAEAARGNF